MEIDNDFKLCCHPRAKKNQSIMDNIFQNKKKFYN